jgi:hypothetical protein
MRKLFISYSHKDAEFAQRLADDLRKEDIVVWIDSTQIKVGDSMVDRISKGLRQHDYFVPVFSPAYFESPWCKKELLIAIKMDIEKKASLLPALLRTCDKPKITSDKIYADFRASYNDGYSSLVAAIRNAKKNRSAANFADVTDELVIGNFQYEHLSNEFVYYLDNRGEQKSSEITFTMLNTDKPRDHHGHGFYIEFDVTSFAHSELRITGIDICVLNWRPLEQITLAGMVLGLSTARLFTGEFQKKIGAYPMQFSVPNSYVKLSEREMEVIHLNVNTPDEGIYDIKTVLHYSVGGKTKSISTPTITELWFVSQYTIRAVREKMGMPH